MLFTSALQTSHSFVRELYSAALRIVGWQWSSCVHEHSQRMFENLHQTYMLQHMRKTLTEPRGTIHGSDKSILEVGNPLQSTSTSPTLMFSRGSYPIVTIFEINKKYNDFLYEASSATTTSKCNIGQWYRWWWTVSSQGTLTQNRPVLMSSSTRDWLQAKCFDLHHVCVHVCALFFVLDACQFSDLAHAGACWIWSAHVQAQSVENVTVTKYWTTLKD